MSGEGGGASNSLNKVLDELRVAVFPEAAEELEERAQEVKRLLDAEMKRGQLTIRPLVRDAKDANRVRRKRRSD